MTGPSAGGKSTFSRQVAEERGLKHICCDRRFLPAPTGPEYDLTRYHNRHRLYPGGVRDFLASIGDSYVADNIPFDPTWHTFSQWAAKEDVEIYCIVPESESSWLERKPAGEHALTHTIWSYFWLDRFPTLGLPVTYILSPGNEEIDHVEAMKRIGMVPLINDHMRQGKYDYRYQDIPELDHKGYSGTGTSWETIRGLVDWESSSVVDCGSFHGHMLFRAGDAGCNGARIGLDFLEPALTTSRAVNLLRNDSVEFRHWEAGQPVPRADVTLCLNALHHFPDSSQPLGTHCKSKCAVESFFNTVKSPTVIFEAYKKYEAAFRSHWNSVSVYPSQRPGRSIYLCR